MPNRLRKTGRRLPSEGGDLLPQANVATRSARPRVSARLVNFPVADGSSSCAFIRPRDVVPVSALIANFHLGQGGHLVRPSVLASTGSQLSNSSAASRGRGQRPNQRCACTRSRRAYAPTKCGIRLALCSSGARTSRQPSAHADERMEGRRPVCFTGRGTRRACRRRRVPSRSCSSSRR